MKSKLLAYTIVVIIALTAFTGCSTAFESVKAAEHTSNAETRSEETSTVSVGVTEANGSFPVTILHSYGEAVIEDVPKKVVVFDMGILDALDALNVNAEFAVPTASVPAYLSEYKNSVNAGGIFEPDFEAIMSFEPDVIFIGTRQASLYDDLNKIAPTVYVELRAENYMEDFKNNINNVGKIFGISELTDNALSEIDNIINDTKEKISQSGDSVLILLTNDGNISAYGLGSRFGIVHEVLGAKPADESITVSTHGQSVGYEYISEVNPDILFVIDRGVIAGASVYASDTLENELVRKTNAYKNDKIIYLNPEAWYLSSGGINSIKVMISEVASAYN